MIDIVVFSALLPPDWLVITLTILAVLVILLVCAAVAKRRRSDFFSFLTIFHINQKKKNEIIPSAVALSVGVAKVRP